MDWNDLIVHRTDLEDWLSSHQPGDDGRANWWLGWVLVAVGKIQSVISAGDIPDFATLDLVVLVIDAATDERAIPSADRVIRLANLASLIAKADPGVRAPVELRPDVAARQCLDLIPQDIAGVELSARRWKSLPTNLIRVLRDIRNLVGPMVRLSPYLEDRDLADRVARWRDVQPYLP